MDHLVVNWDERKIEIPGSIKFLGVKDDDDTRTLYFKMPKIYKGIDITGWNVWINYINAAKKGDHYIVEETTEDDEFIYFEWLAGGSVYSKGGEVRFLVYVWKESDAGIPAQKLHTTWAKLPVLDGGSTSEDYIKDYP